MVIVVEQHVTSMYRAWHSHVGGGVFGTLLIQLAYMLNFVWTYILCFLVVYSFVYTMCSNVEHSSSCIDLTQFNLIFP
ncbi:hypothetical protein GQX74_009702 [Glossina fuscipes]|nr:hypothetical protein GQX74_009702 [Glossina fuscipes]